jgi:ADP-heptose:LPS heptosyltransferase
MYSPWAAQTVALNGWPQKFIFYGAGVGDDLLCTTVAHELRSRKAGTIWIAAKYVELFYGNPDVSVVPMSDWRVSTLAGLLGADVRALWYTTYEPQNDRDPEPPQHFAAMMCARAGVTGSVLIRPYLFLRQTEREEGKIVDRQVAIQSITRAPELPMQNKEWLPERFQQVINALSDQFNFVQLGSRTDPKLDNVVDLRGKTTLRQAAAIMSNSELFVGLASGLMHLARSIDCPAVIVYGGRERPEISGYMCNKNIRTSPPCSPCWQRNRCDHHRKCMTAIEADVVVAGIKQILDCDRNQLSVEVVHV